MSAGLCESCRHARTVVSGRGAAFLRCGRAPADPSFPRFPILPVRQCPGYEKSDPPRAADRVTNE